MIAKVLRSDTSWHSVGHGLLLLHCAEDMSLLKSHALLLCSDCAATSPSQHYMGAKDHVAHTARWQWSSDPLATALS